ncbi:MAG: AAA family ATPase [Deltaproteobacteria bacterium]|nr:AAA family ATPase [Deltaproteobacteria bacterium]
MREWLEKALHGERQIVFVTGEAGIGKTTVVAAFLQQAATAGGLWMAQGQCIEHYGAGEAYLPVLTALGQLCREPRHERLVEVLSQYAPTWLVQMPALLNAADFETLQRKTQGVTRERMLREMAEAVEAITTEQPLVLWLEDLQWSDVSTLDWLAFIARRREQARLLVIGTYRPVDVIVREHPLKAVKQELQVHGQCAELPLGFLSEAHVVEYLAVRFALGVTPALPLQGLARLIHQRTDGNPLFMVNLVEYLVGHGVLVQVEGQWALKRGVEEVVEGVPESLRQMIEQQLERLSPEEQRMLEVASGAGAADSEADVGEVETHCAELVRRAQFLRSSGTGEWPDGTATARYGFLHALYQEVVYDRVTTGRRQRLHQQIGEREEAAYGTRAREIAAELAVHFERGRDYSRAVQYREHAGKNALRRSAYQEAVGPSPEA